MARVFNICFNHKGKSYSALVSVNGKEDASIRITTSNDNIEILLPTGSLTFPIADVLQRLYVGQGKISSNNTFYVTPTICLQLLNTEW